MRVRTAGLTIAGVLALLLGAGVALTHPPIGAWVGRLASVAKMLPTLHWAAFAALQVAVAAFGFFPASLMAIAAGAAYGMVTGVLICGGGAMLGGWIAFLLSRSMLRPWIARLLGRYALSARFDEAIATEGWRFVCLLRVSPVMPFTPTSYGLGLTRVSQRDYLLGTLASLPSLAGFVALGAFGRAGLGLGHGAGGPLQWVLPAAGVAIVTFAVVRLKRLARPPPQVSSTKTS